MRSFLKFEPVYLILAVILFVVEVLIALFVHDHFIRPYLGDVLVVILIYCFVKSFLNTPVLPTALSVLIFSFLIEGLQFVNIVERLGLRDSVILSTVIGTSFAWIDVIAYIAGIATVLFIEKIILNRNSK
jgi:hypothetical protein